MACVLHSHLSRPRISSISVNIQVSDNLMLIASAGNLTLVYMETPSIYVADSTQSFLGRPPLSRLRNGCPRLHYKQFQELLIISGKFALVKATSPLSLSSTWDWALVPHGDWVGASLCFIRALTVKPERLPTEIQILV